jgi:hypothetical protein
VLSAGGGEDFKGSPLDEAIERHHQKRLHEAQLHRKNAATYTAIYNSGYDPETQQQFRDPKTQQVLIPALEEKYKNWKDSAWAAYEKAAGVSKETKAAVQKSKAVVEHLSKAGGPPPSLSGAGGAGGGEQATATEGERTPQASQAPQAATRMTPPPKYDEQAAMGGGALREQMEDNRKFQAYKREEDLVHQHRMEEASGKPEKYEFKTVDDGAGGQKIVAVDKTDPTKPYIEVKSSSGASAKPGAKQFPNEGKLEIVAGIPTGRVMHGGRYIAPGKPGYSADDKEAVKLALTAQGLSDKEKEKLAGIRGAAYAATRAAYQEIPVVDNETGESTFASYLDIARHPGRYVQPGEAEKIAARESVHTSLTANFGALDKDLEALEKKNGLDAEVRTQVQLALRTDNPGLLENMLVTGVKAGYSDEVLRYITDIKAMQEDILVLRNVGGMGQGSDMMRAAMIRLIPGPGTSSVKEARLQMEAARRTSESLFKRRPTARFSSEPDKPRMTQPPKPGDKPPLSSFEIN